METSRPVVVKRIPERFNLRLARTFLNEVRPFLNADRPQIVFDMSQVKQIDAAGVDILLQCMNEAMKRDGDLKLASLSPQASVVLELTRTDRLFEIYQTCTDAAKSFSSFLPNVVHQYYPSFHTVEAFQSHAHRPVMNASGSRPEDDAAA
jgi:anti-anti-sigma factor